MSESIWGGGNAPTGTAITEKEEEATTAKQTKKKREELWQV